MINRKLLNELETQMMDSHLFDGNFKGKDHLWACLFILMGYNFIPMGYHLAMKISRSVCVIQCAMV